ncbi:hypothetical protein PI125_g14861 [Phytophthora idaei]|nr:hypothetical protein PI125_g14861 [Phytophthora idaei]
MDIHLDPASTIVHSPTFENAAIKATSGALLTPAEAKSGARFITHLPVVGEKRKRADTSPDFATAILLGSVVPHGAARSSVVYEPLLTNIPPTSNACERSRRRI